MKTVAIAQARMGSSRFPGKVMRKIGAYEVLAWTIRALQHCKLVDEVILATTTSPKDDQIAEWCAKNSVACFRGSEDDVIGRFVGAVKAHSADVIVRITCDCPFIDPYVVDQVIALREARDVHYASNTWPPTWPDGLDCEVFTSEALVAADHFVATNLDRDCLTQYMERNRSVYGSATLTCPLPDLQKERWVLDTPQDFLFCEQVAEEFDDWKYQDPPSYLEILEFLKKRPKVRNLNAGQPRNERFYAALASEDRQPYVFSRSQRALERAKKVTPLPGQTFSKSWLQYPPDRSPLFVSHGDGGHVFDVDGQRYVDLVGGLLPNVLGYCDPDVDFAIRHQLNSGISFSLATEIETELCERLVRYIPCAEMVRLGKNGADATAGAVRLARGVTKRDRIVLIERGYHGWHDWSIASTERNLGVPFAKLHTNLRLPPDLNRIDDELSRNKTAAVIIEPEFRTYAFLSELKLLCAKHDVILIFDEIISGFRWHVGGYQAHIGVTPDLATVGKSMGNGMPISAIVGRRDLMERFVPPDNVFYSGTFFGEALSIAAAIATIDKIDREQVVPHLWKWGNHLMQDMDKARTFHGLEDVVVIAGEGPRVVIGFKHTLQYPAEMLAGFFRAEMIAHGVLIIGSNNLSFAHNAPEIARCAEAYSRAFARIAGVLANKNPIATDCAVAAGVR